MSATVQNPEALGGWIGAVHGVCETVKTQFRPVPLQWGFAHKAPRRGGLLEDLLLEPGSNSSGPYGAAPRQQQKQQGGRGKGGSSNGRGAGGGDEDGSGSSGGAGGVSSLAAGGSGIGLALNPGLKLDLWIHQELK
jgi:superfamily II RNA helicase